MAKYRAKQRLYIGGAIRRKDEVFVYYGKPRPASHMEPVPDNTPVTGAASNADPLSRSRARLAPAHPDVMAPLVTREQIVKGLSGEEPLPAAEPPASQPSPAEEPNLEDPRLNDLLQ